MFPGGNYLLHPNTYLPCFTYSSTDGEVEVEQNDMDEEAGVEPYGFPSTRRRQNYKDSEIGSVITMLGLYLTFYSNKKSQISTCHHKCIFLESKQIMLTNLHSF